MPRDPLSLYSHRGLLVDLDAFGDEMARAVVDTREAALDAEALERELAHLDSLIPQDEDGAHLNG